MRDDMAKVIVERPRYGRGFKFPRASVRSGKRPLLEDLTRREGIRRPWSGNRKSLNENLSPLRRYLRSQVGRPWDKVYGDICQRINRDSAVQLHVWQHLVEYVCTNPHVIRGDVRSGRLFGRWGFAFFVDPRTGRLRENRQYGRRHGHPTQMPPTDRIVVNDRVEYRLLDGIWYEVQLEPVGTLMGHLYDVVLKKRWPELTAQLLRACHGRSVYAVKKRQLNKKEIRRLPKPD
jgi:hypothetical protein